MSANKDPRDINHDPRRIVTRFVDEFQSAGRAEVGDELLAADFRNWTPNPGEAADRGGVFHTVAMMHSILPDLHVEIHDMLVDGDRVATRKTMRGTHPASRKSARNPRIVSFDVIDIVRVRDGQIVEHWNSLDRLNVIRQLGLTGVLRLAVNRVVDALRQRLARRQGDDTAPPQLSVR